MDVTFNCVSWDPRPGVSFFWCVEKTFDNNHSLLPLKLTFHQASLKKVFPSYTISDSVTTIPTLVTIKEKNLM